MNGVIENSVQKRFTYVLLCMSLLAVPINIEFFKIVRLPDIFFLLAVMFYATTNPKIKSIYITIISLFFGALLLSSLVSILQNNDIRITGVAFYYKYSLLFLIPFVVIKVVDSRRRLQRVVSILYYIYLIMVIWVFIYFILRTNGFLQGHPRVSYPLSNYHIPDAHVYSSYLSFTFVAYYEYIKKYLNHGRIHSVILFVLSAVALLFTGSKTGILVLLVYSSIVIFRFCNTLRRKEVNLVITLVIIATLVSFIIPMYYKDTVLTKDIQTLLYRSTTLNLESSSITVRVNYFLSAIDGIIPNLLLIGNGPTGSNYKWYDGGLSILLAHSGILGVFLLFYYIYLLIIKSQKMSKSVKMSYLHKAFTLLILTYSLLNIITEHSLLTRNLLPVATLLSVIYVNIRLYYFESLAMKTYFNK